MFLPVRFHPDIFPCSENRTLKGIKNSAVFRTYAIKISDLPIECVQRFVYLQNKNKIMNIVNTECFKDVWILAWVMTVDSNFPPKELLSLLLLWAWPRLVDLFSAWSSLSDMMIIVFKILPSSCQMILKTSCFRTKIGIKYLCPI